MGYTGGTSINPTYRNLVNHSEAIEITYDPTVITYGELLEAFWQGHNPSIPAASRQYQSFIFFHDEEQMNIAVESKTAQEAQLGKDVSTEIRAAVTFYAAEDYHQKYYLKIKPEIQRALLALYPDHDEYVASTVVARMAGYAGGFISAESLVTELEILGIERGIIINLLEAAGEDAVALCPVPSTGS